MHISQDEEHVELEEEYWTLEDVLNMDLGAETEVGHGGSPITMTLTHRFMRSSNSAPSVKSLQAIHKKDPMALTRKDGSGRTPIHWLMRNDQLHLTREITDAIKSIDPGAFTRTSKSGRTPIHSFMRNNHVEFTPDIMKIIKGLDASAFTRTTVNRTSIRHIMSIGASGTAAPGSMQSILDGAADSAGTNKNVHVGDKIGVTPIHLLLENQNFTLSPQLVLAMMDMDPKALTRKGGPDGETPVHCLMRNKNLKLTPVMMRALRSIDKEIFQTPDNFGETPVHWLVRNTHFTLTREVIQELLDSDTERDAERGDTFFHHEDLSGKSPLRLLLGFMPTDLPFLVERFARMDTELLSILLTEPIPEKADHRGVEAEVEKAVSRGQEYFECWFELTLPRFASDGRCTWARLGCKTIVIVLNEIEERIREETEGETTDQKPVTNAITTILRLHAADSVGDGMDLLSRIEEYPPAPDALRQMASSAFFRCLIQLVATQGAILYFRLDFGFFVTLGACFTRLTWVRTTQSGFTVNTTQSIVLCVYSLLVTAYFLIREIGQVSTTPCPI